MSNKTIINSNSKLIDIDGLNTFKDRLRDEFNNKITNNEQAFSTALDDLNNRKQDELVSGVNVKTINGESILGGGDIAISKGEESYDSIGDDEILEILSTEV